MENISKLIGKISESKDLTNVIHGEILRKYGSLDINKFEYYNIIPETRDSFAESKGFKSIHHPKARKVGRILTKKPSLSQFEKYVLNQYKYNYNNPKWISEIYSSFDRMPFEGKILKSEVDREEISEKELIRNLDHWEYQKKSNKKNLTSPRIRKRYSVIADTYQKKISSTTDTEKTKNSIKSSKTSEFSLLEHKLKSMKSLAHEFEAQAIKKNIKGYKKFSTEEYENELNWKVNEIDKLMNQVVNRIYSLRMENSKLQQSTKRIKLQIEKFTGTELNDKNINEGIGMYFFKNTKASSIHDIKASEKAGKHLRVMTPSKKRSILAGDKKGVSNFKKAVLKASFNESEDRESMNSTRNLKAEEIKKLKSIYIESNQKIKQNTEAIFDLECEISEFKRLSKQEQSKRMNFYKKLLNKGLDCRETGIVWIVMELSLLGYKGRMEEIDQFFPAFLDSSSKEYLIKRCEYEFNLNELNSNKCSLIEVYKAKNPSKTDFSKQISYLAKKYSPRTRGLLPKSEAYFPKLEFENSNNPFNTSSSSKFLGDSVFFSGVVDKQVKMTTLNERLYDKSREMITKAIRSTKKSMDLQKSIIQDIVQEETDSQSMVPRNLKSLNSLEQLPMHDQIRLFENDNEIYNYESAKEFVEENAKIDRKINAIKKKLEVMKTNEINRIVKGFELEGFRKRIGLNPKTILRALFGYSAAKEIYKDKKKFFDSLNKKHPSENTNQFRYL